MKLSSLMVSKQNWCSIYNLKHSSKHTAVINAKRPIPKIAPVVIWWLTVALFVAYSFCLYPIWTSHSLATVSHPVLLESSCSTKTLPLKMRMHIGMTLYFECTWGHIYFRHHTYDYVYLSLKIYVRFNADLPIHEFSLTVDHALYD